MCCECTYLSRYACRCVSFLFVRLSGYFLLFSTCKNKLTSSFDLNSLFWLKWIMIVDQSPVTSSMSRSVKQTKNLMTNLKWIGLNFMLWHFSQTCKPETPRSVSKEGRYSFENSKISLGYSSKNFALTFCWLIGIRFAVSTYWQRPSEYFITL